MWWSRWRLRPVFSATAWVRSAFVTGGGSASSGDLGQWTQCSLGARAQCGDGGMLDLGDRCPRAAAAVLRATAAVDN